MTNKTEAQRLAADLARNVAQTDAEDDVIHVPRWTAEQAAAELLRLDAENAALRALLAELVDIEGPQPGTSEWGDKARAALSGTAPARVPLTDEQIEALFDKLSAEPAAAKFSLMNWFQAGLTIGEAAHGITGDAA